MSTVRPVGPAQRRHGDGRTVLAGAGVLALMAGAALPLRWVHSGPSLCPSRLLTGLPCPGCGLVRGIAHTLHGDLTGAVGYHAFAPLVVAGVLAYAVLAWHSLRTRAPGPSADRWLRSPAGLVLVGALAAYGLVRMAGAVRGWWPWPPA